MTVPTTPEIVATLREEFGNNVSRKQVILWSKGNNYSHNTILNRLTPYKQGRGVYHLNDEQTIEKLESSLASPPAEPVGEVKTIVKEFQSLVPPKDPLFVQFGVFKDIKSVIKSGIFYPVFVTGETGNGKTHAVKQACAQLNRDFIRVNITVETDADDLLGGFRLVNGETVYHSGPVVEAMERGAILLIDEIDLASNKIMCLQSILEGNGVFLKKINKHVYPKPGFNVIATANTKGRGSDTGKYIGTNVLNEAFLERFAVTLEQEYPSPSIEKKILLRNFESLGIRQIDDKVDNLVTWAELIRKTYDDGGIDDVISTRRLVNIAKAYAIWNENMTKAIEVTTNRFDADTKQVFVELYEKVSGDSEKEKETDSSITDEPQKPSETIDTDVNSVKATVSRYGRLTIHNNYATLETPKESPIKPYEGPDMSSYQALQAP